MLRPLGLSPLVLSPSGLIQLGAQYTTQCVKWRPGNGLKIKRTLESSSRSIHFRSAPFFKLKKNRSRFRPTEYLTLSKQQNASIHVAILRENRRCLGFEVLKLRNVWSGRSSSRTASTLAF